MTGSLAAPETTAGNPDPVDEAPPSHRHRLLGPAGRARHARSRRPPLRPPLRVAWLVGCGVFGLQLIGLLIWSWHLWTRFDLTADMATFSQAWQQIATGHLNPYETTFAYNYPHWGYPFYQSHFELIMWPLALVYWLWPHAIDLLVIQDLALAGIGLVAYRWGIEHLDANWPRRNAAVPAGVLLVILVANPWTYWVASFDFHFEPIAVFFTILAGRDLWAGRNRAWVWVGLALLCGDVATTYIIALGIAALIGGRQVRLRGLSVAVAGVVWLAIIGLIGADKGSGLATNYGYLAGHPVGEGIGGLAAIVGGMVAHPSVPGHLLNQRRADIYGYIAGAGTAGVVSALGAVTVLLVLLPNALNVNVGFISNIAAFQSLVVVVACAVGTVMLMTWLAGRRWPGTTRRPWLMPAIAIAIGLAAVVQVVVVSASTTDKARTTFARVGPSAAAELARVDATIPAGDEVIVSQGVMGRFGARALIYPFLDAFANGQTVPVFGETVYTVFVPDQGIESASPAQTLAAEALMRRLGARQVADRDGVVALRWHRPDRRHTIVFAP